MSYMLLGRSTNLARIQAAKVGVFRGLREASFDHSHSLKDGALADGHAMGRVLATAEKPTDWHLLRPL